VCILGGVRMSGETKTTTPGIEGTRQTVISKWIAKKKKKQLAPINIETVEEMNNWKEI
jgi:hypothetical protein